MTDFDQVAIRVAPIIGHDWTASARPPCGPLQDRYAGAERRAPKTSTSKQRSAEPASVPRQIDLVRAELEPGSVASAKGLARHAKHPFLEATVRSMEATVRTRGSKSVTCMEVVSDW
jgi:hypothetical protein